MASRPGPPGATYLTIHQANQLLEKLKGMKNIEGQTIKIQTIQTNPHTGAKQIVAIPLPTVSVGATSTAAPSTLTTAHQNLSISPLKSVKSLFGEQRSPMTATSPVMHTGLLQGTTRTIKIGSPRPINVSVATGTSGHTAPFSIIKPAVASSSLQTGLKGVSNLLVQSVVDGNAGNGAQSVHAGLVNNGHQNMSLPLTPQKKVVETSLSTVSVQNVTFESLKRPHDFDSGDIVSEAKRKKTEKGNKKFLLVMRGKKGGQRTLNRTLAVGREGKNYR